MWVRSCWLRACTGDAGLTAPGSCPSPLHIPTQWERTYMFQPLFPAPVARFCRAALTVRLYRPTSNPAPCQSPAAAAPGSEPLKRSVSRERFPDHVVDPGLSQAAAAGHNGCPQAETAAGRALRSGCWRSLAQRGAAPSRAEGLRMDPLEPGEGAQPSGAPCFGGARLLITGARARCRCSLRGKGARGDGEAAYCSSAGSLLQGAAAQRSGCSARRARRRLGRQFFAFLCFGLGFFWGWLHHCFYLGLREGKDSCS